MNPSYTILACVALLLCSCQPTPRCDPDQVEMGGGCYAKPAADSGAGKDEDAGDGTHAGDAATDGGDSSLPGNECPGDPYEGFGVECTGPSDCTCHAPDCATNPLGYCTKLNCDVADTASCPPEWTCLMIPAGASPDPNLKTLCLKP